MEQPTGFEDSLVEYARGPSRRGFFRLITGAFGTILAGGTALAAAPSSAAAEPNCFWQYPTNDLSSCVKVRHHEGHSPSTNGCGPSGWKNKAVRDHWGKANFTPSCNKHDVCYGTCGSNKSDCDLNLAREAMNACGDVYGDSPTRRAACETIATIYGIAVDQLGDGPFDDAQKEDCDCCHYQNVAYCQPDDSCWYSATACLQVCPSGMKVAGQNLCGPPPDGKCDT